MRQLPLGSQIQGSPALERKRDREAASENAKGSPQDFHESHRPTSRPRLASDQPASDIDPPTEERAGAVSVPSRLGPRELGIAKTGLSASAPSTAPEPVASLRSQLLRNDAAAAFAMQPSFAASVPRMPNSGYQAFLAHQLASRPGPHLVFPSPGVHPSHFLLQRQHEEREHLLREIAATRAAERILASRAGASIPLLTADIDEQLSLLQSHGDQVGIPLLPGGLPLSSASLYPGAIPRPPPGSQTPASALLAYGPQVGAPLQGTAAMRAGALPPSAFPVAPESALERSLDWRTRRFLGLPPVPASEASLGLAARHPSLRAFGVEAGHPPVDMFMPCDEDVLSAHQVLLRKQIEFFEATPHDLHSMGAGRRRDISAGHVGIRCKHCAILPSHERPRGSMYFPATLRALYQAAQNMDVSHFNGKCRQVDKNVQKQLVEYQVSKCKAGHAGKKWWANGARACGVVEIETGGLRFRGPSETNGPRT